MGNAPPVCVINGPTVVACQGATTQIVLDGSGSFDPEGQPLTYFWQSCPGSLIDDPTAATITLTLDTSANCNVSCPVRLYVNDGNLTTLCRIFTSSVDPAEVGDTVFCDTDDDGVQDAGEPGLAGVTVMITCAGEDMILGTADDFTSSQVTDNNGNYLFTGLLPGLCEVAVDAATAPRGKALGSCPSPVIVQLRAGASELDIDFCFVNDGEIGDTVFCDLDGDGVQDPGEPGIAGVTIDLVCAGPDGAIGTADDFTAATTTDVNGNYLFTELAPDSCVVTVDATTLPQGKIPGDDCPSSFAVDLAVVGMFLDADFCFENAGEIGDTVFCDLDNDGVQDPGEPGLAGVTVTLACAGPDGMIGTADDLTDMATTDGNGNYLFADLPLDLCQVQVDPTMLVDKVIGQCPTEFTVDLGVMQSFLDADFCFITPGEVGDTVFCDLDLDGIQDPGEPGIPNVIVDLVCAGPDGVLGTFDDFTDTAITAANGNYLFSGVPPGDCEVTVDVNSAPAGKIPGPCPTMVAVTLQPDQAFLAADFCFQNEPGKVGDTVFCDLDDDGVQDPGEPGIAGVTVDLTCAGVDGMLGTPDDFTASTTTDGSGNYLFTDVPPGLCEAAVDPSTAPPDKVLGQCPPVIAFALKSGQEFLDADYCFTTPPPGSISGTVFCDRNDDGVQDPLEPGIPGVTVDLVCSGPDGRFGTPDDVTDLAVTDANGMYSFMGVAADDCLVSVDSLNPPAGKVSGQCPDEILVKVVPGGAAMGIDFCFKNEPGKIGDQVYCDLDNDGVFDAGEPGIADVIVDLVCAGPDGAFGTADDFSASMLTDASGNYQFTDVPTPDSCLVTVDESTAPVDKVPGRCPTQVAVKLQPGQDFADADFCFVTPGQIGDFVWCDLDDDGVLDAGEPGLAGVDIKLLCGGPDGILGNGDDFSDCATTDVAGTYLFAGVPPGPCQVTVDLTTLPEGKGVGQCPTQLSLQLMPGELFLDADFCFRSVGAKIGDKVFCDLDDDGYQDLYEPGIPGVKVELRCVGYDGQLYTADDIVLIEVTDANGCYLFSGLPAQWCRVRVKQETAPPDKILGECPEWFGVDLKPDECFLGADFCFITCPGGVSDDDDGAGDDDDGQGGNDDDDAAGDDDDGAGDDDDGNFGNDDDDGSGSSDDDDGAGDDDDGQGGNDDDDGSGDDDDGQNDDDDGNAGNDDDDGGGDDDDGCPDNDDDGDQGCDDDDGAQDDDDGQAGNDDDDGSDGSDDDDGGWDDDDGFAGNDDDDGDGSDDDDGGGDDDDGNAGNDDDDGGKGCDDDDACDDDDGAGDDDDGNAGNDDDDGSSDSDDDDGSGDDDDGNAGNDDDDGDCDDDGDDDDGDDDDGHTDDD